MILLYDYNRFIENAKITYASLKSRIENIDSTVARYSVLEKRGLNSPIIRRAIDPGYRAATRGAKKDLRRPQIGSRRSGGSKVLGVNRADKPSNPADRWEPGMPHRRCLGGIGSS
jgi:hypothetical protein